MNTLSTPAPNSNPSPTRPRQVPLADSMAAAAEAIAGVLQGRTLDSALADLPADIHRAAVMDLAYTTLREFGRGDFILSRLMERPPQIKLRALLLIAVARLWARPQDTHTTVDQAVRAAVMVLGDRGKGVVNGVLRNALRQQNELVRILNDQDVARWQHPSWWLHQLREAYPEAWKDIVRANNSHPPMTLRVNARKASVDLVLTALRQESIDAVQNGPNSIQLIRPIPVDKLPGFVTGEVSVQDLGAQRAAHLLDVRNGQRVLDACAAPGGKTAHMLELADLEMLALDIDTQRCQRIRDNLQRLGLQADVKAADCRDVANWWDGKPFDRILADVPCSASGVARRHPDIKWLRRSGDITQFARQQQEITDALWRVLAPGGKMLYATCSVFPEENRRSIEAFLARHPDCQQLTLDDAPDLQMLPCPEHDGFYYALLQKHSA